MMKPILFNTEMVRAILDGRKTVTRRVVKTEGGWPPLNHSLGFIVAGDSKDIGKYAFGDKETGGHIRYARPPFTTGDILYVREAWSELSYGYEYKADGKRIDHLGNRIKYKPSIHMPKEAARIYLKVTGVHVERLRNITQEDAIKEGVTVCEFDKEGGFYERDEFIELWDTTIKKDQLQYYGWDANPYVWVIEFEVTEQR